MEISSIPYRPYLPDQSVAASESAAAAAARRQKGSIDRRSELYKVSLQFEAIFIKQMLNVMRQSVDKSGLIDGGMAEDIFEDMLYDEYAKKMAESRQLGIADIIYEQLGPQERTPAR
jgi:Rod binding domain-containing protein